MLLKMELSHLRGRLLLWLASLYKAKPIAKFIHLIIYNKTESSGRSKLRCSRRV